VRDPESGDINRARASSEAPVSVRFADLILDLVACTLSRDTGETIPLTRGEFALLRFFVTHPGRVLSRDALLEATAGRRFAPFDRSIDVMVGRLRRKIEPDPKARRLIVTAPGDGYKFAVEPRDVRPTAAPERQTKGEHSPSELTVLPVAALPLPSKPSIAVLPFQNMSGDPEQDYFADGMVEDIVTGLSRIKWLFVIARNSSAVYKGRTVDVRQVGRELGVRYLLEGGVRKSGRRLRITVQLIEAESGAHLWADKFDGELEDVFDLQDRITERVVGIVEPSLFTGRCARTPARGFGTARIHPMVTRPGSLSDAAPRTRKSLSSTTRRRGSCARSSRSRPVARADRRV
jgi:TolB-like protein